MRVEAIEAAWPVLLQKPLFGWGLLSAGPVLSAAIGHPCYVDDTYVTYLVELGVLGAWSLRSNRISGCSDQIGRSGFRSPRRVVEAVCRWRGLAAAGMAGPATSLARPSPPDQAVAAAARRAKVRTRLWARANQRSTALAFALPRTPNRCRPRLRAIALTHSALAARSLYISFASGVPIRVRQAARAGESPGSD